MGFRFRRTIKIAPGVRLNFGKNGVSTSVGKRGAGVTFGPNGTTAHVGIPGTGISYTSKLNTNKRNSKSSPMREDSSSCGSCAVWLVALIALGICMMILT